MLHQQAWSFAVAFMTGIVAGMIIDLYRVGCTLLKLRKIGLTIGDILTWLVISAVAFGLLLVGNWAEIRLYVVVGLVIGLMLYLRLASQTFRGVVFRAVNTIRWLIIGTLRTLIKPIKILLWLMQFPLRVLRGFIFLTMRQLEYVWSFPQIALHRFCRNIKSKINPPPQT
ncbi:MAG: spore cortex biosynthesis protein YabQ [Peptococcaceae bacterium]|nr:spore cortex biosynthesis protein YabQ [Peptococcaceae bacterium]